jgi:4-hydroxy-3-polyprenylbenzoate decarboxylase
VDVIREEVTGLPIPATAEIVIAGEMPPRNEETRMEGPFGEFTGYYASGARPEPVIHIKALYHRNEPIILGVPPEKYRGSTWHFGLPASASRDKEKLRRDGIEDVLDICQAAWPGVKVVQVRQRYAGHAMRAAMGLVGEYTTKFIILVDEDINPRDPMEVFWALGTRCDPARATQVINGLRSTPLDPSMSPEQKERGDLTSSCMILNACKPYEWKDQFPITNVASPELRQATMAKWKDLF